MNDQEPYPFASIFKLKPCGRHKILTAVVFQTDPPRCGDGYRYMCLFPANGMVYHSKVYSNEIESVAGMDLDGKVLCSGCTPDTRARCRAQEIIPATCA